MDEHGGLAWYDGLVFNLIDKATFKVIYSDEDEVYQFELLEDYHEGDLQLILWSNLLSFCVILSLYSYS